jgi:hypothetical protein
VCEESRTFLKELKEELDDLYLIDGRYVSEDQIKTQDTPTVGTSDQLNKVGSPSII